jgi:iron(III) transport system ATP-binding protein
MSWLKLDDVCLCYTPGEDVVKHVSITLEKGQIACLVGPSGCGKTSLLRAIAGFEPICGGKIFCRDKLLNETYKGVAPEKRNIGIVFQDFALFPHLSVEDNIGFGLAHLSAKERSAETKRWLEWVDLSDVAHRYPHEISGGQQQRVALARALAPQPELLLMDEPFSQLDPDLRAHLLEKLRDILRSLGITAILVTHHPEDSFLVADYLGLMKQGKLVQWGSPYEVYHEPKTPFVAHFMGCSAFLTGEYQGARDLQTELGPLTLKAPLSIEAQKSVKILVRPDDVLHDDASPMKARVVAKSFHGAYYTYKLSLPSGEQIFALVQSHHNHAEGSWIGIRLEMDHVVCFTV